MALTCNRSMPCVRHSVHQRSAGSKDIVETDGRTDGHDRSHYLPRQCEAVCNQDHLVEAVKRQYQRRVIRKTRKLTNTARSRVYVKAGRPSVCLSVCPIIRPPHSAAAGLLLCARRAGDIDRLLHGRPAGVQQQMRAVSR